MKRYSLLVEFTDGTQEKFFSSISPTVIRNKSYVYRNETCRQHAIKVMYVYDNTLKTIFGNPIPGHRTHPCYYKGKEDWY